MEPGLFPPLRAEHDLGQLADANPAPVELLEKTEAAVMAAMKCGYPPGWLFGREGFIKAARAIRGLSVETYGTPLAESLPVAWRRLADVVEAYVKQALGANASLVRPSIDRGVVSSSWNHPASGHALESFFQYCLAAAKMVYRKDADAVETYYKTGVFNIPLNTTRTLARLEAGQGETHRMLQTAEEMAETRHREVVDLIRANGNKIDILVGRNCDLVVDAKTMAGLISEMLKTKGNYKGISQRAVEYWIQYLKTGGQKGRQPPEGFTLTTLSSLEKAAQFAIACATGEAARLKAKTAYDVAKARKEESEEEK